MHRDVIIIGGGVAGLSAAMELIRLGILPMVVEAGSYPAHKVCGEFLSPESLPLLNKWNIDPVHIKQARFQTNKENLTFSFPKPAGSLSHYTLDPALMLHAKSLGADILTQVKVETFIPKNAPGKFHELKLSTGQTVTASTIVIATGRLPNMGSLPTAFKYMGIKAHFSRIELSSTLEMFGFREAYLGLCPIEEGKVNLACLAKTQRVKEAGSIQNLMEELINENKKLKELVSGGTCLFDEWMSAPIPFFGFKNTPDWPDTYFIGDAAMSIPPACGGGLSFGISSGILAAHYAIMGDYVGFKKKCRSQSSSMLIAKGMHHVFMNPLLSKLAFAGCSIFPSLPQKIFQTTRQVVTDVPITTK